MLRTTWTQADGKPFFLPRILWIHVNIHTLGLVQAGLTPVPHLSFYFI